ncbi:MAG: shikimate kinase [Candidatus Wallbacteria bacterium]|nr:shikimate kinase [Candidatus Wallbacteria bacterium]
MKDKVFLVGFMGCGKTTVGKLLAKKMGRPFFDVDREVEQNEGKKVSEIFAESGEEHFRSLETEWIKSVCKGKKAVVSGGGGCFCRPQNREIIKKNCTTVYLEAEFETLLERILKDNDRPLAQNLEELHSLFDQRIQDYEKTDFSVRIDDRSPLEIVEEIIKVIGE